MKRLCSKFQKDFGSKPDLDIGARATACNEIDYLFIDEFAIGLWAPLVFGRNFIS